MSVTKVKHIIRLYEQKSYRLGEYLANGQYLDQELWATLVIQQENYSRYYRINRSNLKLFQFVGIIPMGKYLLEILPKLDELEELDQQSWSNFLMTLLIKSNFGGIHYTGRAELKFGKHDLHHSIIAYFIECCKTLLRRGKMRHYQQEKVRSLLPKGRIDWARQYRKLPVPPPVLHLYQRKLQEDHPYDQIIAAAIQLLANWPNDHQNSQLLKELQSDFPLHYWPDQQMLSDDSLPYGLYAQSYGPCLRIARNLLWGYGPKLNIGDLEAPSMVFDMNVLFEDYIYQQLTIALPSSAKVDRQVRKLFWRRQTIRPDIVLDLDGQSYVLDTKWKKMEGGKPSAQDLRQLYVYQRVFAARKGILVYPKLGQYSRNISAPYLNAVAEPDNYEAQIIYAPVIKDGQLNENLGQDLIAAFQQLAF